MQYTDYDGDMSVKLLLTGREKVKNTKTFLGLAIAGTIILLIFALKREGMNEIIGSEALKPAAIEQDSTDAERVPQETSSETGESGTYLRESDTSEESDESVPTGKESVKDEKNVDEPAETDSEVPIGSIKERYRGSELLSRANGGRNESLSIDSMNFDPALVGTGQILADSMSIIFCPKDDDWLEYFDRTVGNLEQYIYTEFPEWGMPEFVEVYPYGENHLIECVWNTGTLLYYEMYFHPRSERYEMRGIHADPAEVQAMRSDYLKRLLESDESKDNTFAGMVNW